MAVIYYNGTVYTGSECVEAFAVENGVFTACGTSAELLASASEHDTKVDLEGKFVCAGFNDSHMHLLNFGQSLHMAQLAKHTESLADMLECVKDYIASADIPEGQWIKGRGWNHDYFSDVHRMPNRHDLDSVCADHPMLLTRCCGHVAVANTKALELAGITVDTVAPIGGAIGVEDGELDGRLYDNGIQLLTPVIPEPTKDELKEMIKLGVHALNAYGVTSSQSDDYCVYRDLPFETINEAYRELAAEGELTCRVYEQANFTDLDKLESFVNMGYHTGVGDDFFKIGPLKMLGDGSLGGRTAFLSRPYADDPSQTGFALFTPEHMNALVSYANSHNMNVAIHAIGDACLDQVLNAVENALNECPREDHRHGIVHCQISRADQLERIARLKMHVFAQSIFLDYDNHIVEARAGKELASTSYSWKTLMNMGVSVSNGTDCPVELPNALEGIECAVTRTSLDGTGPYLPHEAFTVKEALDSYTIRSAEGSFEENVKGLIAPNYFADFVVLAEDPFKVEPAHIHDIKVCATYVGGKAVFEA